MLVMRYHGTTTVPVEAECIRPDLLQGKSLSEIANLVVHHGNATATVGDFFTLEGDASDAIVEIHGDCSRVKLLGSGMTGGKLTIHGPAGMHVGAEMTGGELIVEGNASDWVGAEMRGGLLRVKGNAGHLIGAAYRGGHVGMRGGTLIIDGATGNEIGACMRRGLIIVGGAGDYPGSSMIAGSLFILGTAGIRPGANMKRGTIAFFGPAPQVLPTFRRACTYEPIFMRLYIKKLEQLGVKVPQKTRWTRYCGDLVTMGKGELLVGE
jgi:formylmethanofuran dehydrogenase subunit C